MNRHWHSRDGMFQPLAETARLVIYKEEIVNDLETEWIESTGCAQNDDKSRRANCLMFGPYGHCTRSNLCSKNCWAGGSHVGEERFQCVGPHRATWIAAWYLSTDWNIILANGRKCNWCKTSCFSVKPIFHGRWLVQVDTFYSTLPYIHATQ
jgi:hypothetical protein